MKLNKETARHLLLAAQGLLDRPVKTDKVAVLETICRMGALQIDTINVVARSPYIVLWSRLGDYEPEWLDELLSTQQIFEYWSHEACFLPIEDYPLYRHRMLNPESMGWKYRADWVAENAAVMQRLLEVIRERGAVKSSDFEQNSKSHPWWGWKPEKRGLEMLFTSGRVMVARRHNFQRVYDLRERVLPDWDDSLTLTTEQAARALIKKAVKALGVATPLWIADYFRMQKSLVKALVPSLVEDGALITMEMDGAVYYLHPDNLSLARSITEGLRSNVTTLLSPFDPVVWDRSRTLALFDYDYRLECYTPAPKRRYGYFTLPILHRGNLIGRLDPKAHRKERVFEVKSLHLERTVDDPSSILEVVERFARWNGCEKVVWSKIDATCEALFKSL